MDTVFLYKWYCARKSCTSDFTILQQVDRMYLKSLYFREPNGILFEIATDESGFTVDEPLDLLGTDLKLPPQHEPYRDQIIQVLPKLN